MNKIMLEVRYKNGKRKLLLVDDVEFYEHYTICFRFDGLSWHSFTIQHNSNFTGVDEVWYKGLRKI